MTATSQRNPRSVGPSKTRRTTACPAALRKGGDNRLADAGTSIVVTCTRMPISWPVH